MRISTQTDNRPYSLPLGAKEELQVSMPFNFTYNREKGIFEPAVKIAQLAKVIKLNYILSSGSMLDKIVSEIDTQTCRSIMLPDGMVVDGKVDLSKDPEFTRLYYAEVFDLKRDLSFIVLSFPLAQLYRKDDRVILTGSNSGLNQDELQGYLFGHGYITNREVTEMIKNANKLVIDEVKKQVMAELDIVQVSNNA